MSASILAITDLRKSFAGHARYGRVNAVDGIGFDVGEAEFFTLLGPSGCGKTTTLRAIAGLERPDHGRITIGDRVVHDSTHGTFVQPNDRGIGMVFQSYAIWPHMSVFENVAFPLRVRKSRIRGGDLRARVFETLRVVQLEGIAERSATTLSGGQQQRLALARALVFEPVLMLLDEPLSNLDAKLRESMRFELKRLQTERGLTTVYVTHDQAEALALSTQIAVMNAGKIEQLGTPDEIYGKPMTAFVADFIGSANFLHGTLRRLTDSGGEVETEGGIMHVSEVRDVNVGDHCVIAIRPEHVEILLDGKSEEVNLRRGTVLAGAYTGQAIDYEVRVGDKTLRCRMPATTRLSFGERVGLHLPPAHCVALRAVSPNPVSDAPPADATPSEI